MLGIINYLFLKRLAFWLLIVSVMALAVISELTNQRAKAVLTSGIRLTDARVGAAQLLQLLTDAETAQRGYLLTGNPSYLEPLRNAQKQFDLSVGFLDFFDTDGPDGPQGSQAIRALVAGKFTELDRTVALAQAGDRTQAFALVQTDAGKQLMDDLRGLFQVKLQWAAQMQQGARNSIFNALLVSRLAVAILCGLLGIAWLVHARQLRRQEIEQRNYQQKLESEVAEKTFDLRTLGAWLEAAREDEKAQLARLLHDELGGNLTAAKLNLARVQKKLVAQNEVVEPLNSAIEQLRQSIALKRQIIENLRPSTLSTLGLKIALETLCFEAQQEWGCLIVQAIDTVQLTSGAELALLRVTQEALTNIRKHAGATEVLVRLHQIERVVQLDIVDNGIGFETELVCAGQQGVASMRFRMENHGGSLCVTSSPNQGVRVTATLPASSAITAGANADDPQPGSQLQNISSGSE